MLFALVTGLVYYGVTAPVDSAVVAAASLVGGTLHELDIVMALINETGDVFYMFVFGMFLLIVRRTRRIGISIMISMVIVTIITGYAKCAIDHDRPDLEYAGATLPTGIGTETVSLFCDAGYDSAYPSGHASRAAVFGIVLGAALCQVVGRSAYLILLYPVLVSASRVYVLEHHPFDVVGGVILGILVAGIVAKKARIGEARESSEP